MLLYYPPLSLVGDCCFCKKKKNLNVIMDSAVLSGIYPHPHPHHENVSFASTLISQ